MYLYLIRCKFIAIKFLGAVMGRSDGGRLEFGSEQFGSSAGVKNTHV